MRVIHKFEYNGWSVIVRAIPGGYSYTASQPYPSGATLKLDGKLAKEPYEVSGKPMIQSIEGTIRNNIARQERQTNRRIYGRNWRGSE